jgi:hypothetical protein
MTRKEQQNLRDLRSRITGARWSIQRALAKRARQIDYPEGQITTLNMIERWMDEFGFTANAPADLPAEAGKVRRDVVSCGYCGATVPEDKYTSHLWEIHRIGVSQQNS